MAVPARDTTTPGLSSGTRAATQPAPKQRLRKPSETKKVYNADDAIDVVNPFGPLSIGQPYKLYLRFHKDGLLDLTTKQEVMAAKDYPTELPFSRREFMFPADKRRWEEKLRQVQESVEPIETIQTDGDGTYIEIAPLRLGQVRLAIEGLFKDLGSLHKYVNLNVIEGTSAPVSIFSGMGPQQLMNLDKRRELRAYVLAFYSGVREPQVVDPRLVRVDVTSDSQLPVVSLDRSRSTLTALRAGTAVVSLTYSGHTLYSCVVVRDQPIQETQGNVSPSSCSHLLRDGQVPGGRVTLP